MHSKIKKLVIAALMSAMVCVATMIIKIPSPMKGYLNIGDCIVLLCGWMLAPGYGFLAAGIGSAIADIFSSYITYAPATFLIKGTMALVAFACYKLLSKRIGKLPSQIIGGLLAEVTMVMGYYVFEGFMYGWDASLVNIPANAIQGVIGLVAGVALSTQLIKIKGLQSD
jgi:uncharacterized membrane protein